jgi:hypothetical protein
MQESIFKILGVSLPLATFALGYFLNRLLERRKGANARIAKAATDLIALLNEWHAALSELAVVCETSDSIADIASAFGRYRKQRDIATRIQFCLALLRSHKVADPLTAAAERIYHQFNPDRDPLIKPASFTTIDAILMHRLSASITVLLHALSSDDPEMVPRVRDQIKDTYMAFEEVLSEATLEAATLIESRD